LLRTELTAIGIMSDLALLTRSRRLSPYRHQSVSRHLELRGAPLDGGSLVGAFYVAEPDGLRGDLVEPHLIGIGGGSGFLAMR
jgi:hypothetical protein